MTGKHEVTAKHVAAVERKGFRRWLTVPMALVMLATLSTIALAAWLIFFTWTGTTTAGDFGMTDTGGTVVATGGTCTIDGEAPLVITWTGGVLGDTCTVSAHYFADIGNSMGVAVQSFTGDYAGTEVSTTLGGFCGFELLAGEDDFIDVTFELTADSSPGGVYTMGAGAGMTWVPTSTYVPGSCS